MSSIDERIKEIKTQYVGKTNARVLLVEGSDDKDAFRIFLNAKFPGWERAWILEDAGNKDRVLRILKKESNWIGVVDRDEWSDADVEEKESANPNLKVLPRFCLESYLIDPVELWAALPAKQQAKVSGGEEAFRQALLANLSEWIRHAALWHGVRPLWRQLHSMGFPDSVLGNPPMPDDHALKLKFKEWHVTLDADVVLSRVHALQEQLTAEKPGVLFSKWLYAKDFYPQVVHSALNKLLGQKPAKERRLAILRARSVPADLDGVWRAMGLQI